MSVQVFEGDLPEGFVLKGSLAVDTETTGLNFARDRLCLVQVRDEDDKTVLIRFPKDTPIRAPRLLGALANPSALKIFHFARFDVAVLYRALNVRCDPLFCTKIASKLVRTYTKKHGLMDISADLLGLEISKQEQRSDWGTEMLTEDQFQYASNDVANLHALKDKLEQMLYREGRLEIANDLFRAIFVRSQLDSLGWADEDIFAH